MKIHNHRNFLDRRKELRQNHTPQERVLWNHLRNSKLGVRFRRQHSFGGYILDFYCFKARLIIELDSDSHDRKYDRVRDKYFNDLGYKTMRIQNVDINNKLEQVLDTIRQTLSLRLGEGGEAG